MSRPRLTRLTVVWLVLVAATLLSWYFGAGHGIGSSPTATALVLVIAFAKVRLIGLDFMELRAAPIWLRATSRATAPWCAELSSRCISWRDPWGGTGSIR